jgi:hypothetical protein
MIDAVMRRGRRAGAVVSGSALGIAVIPMPAIAHAPGGHALASATAAAAHHYSPEAPAAVSHALGAPWLTLGVLLLVALGGVVLGRMLRRDRRIGLAALAFLLATTAFESGYHGVHHLGDPRGAERCAALATTAHLDAVTDAAPAAVVPDVARDPLPVLRLASPPALTLTLGHEGRAPPAAASL